jgi:hypothetical protein
MNIRFLEHVSLELLTAGGELSEQVYYAGDLYPIERVVLNEDETLAHLYFFDGVAEFVDTKYFELHGRIKIEHSDADFIEE